MCGGATARRPGGGSARGAWKTTAIPAPSLQTTKRHVRGATSRFADTSTLAMLSIAPGAALALGARVAPRVAPRVARRASPPPRRLVVVAGSDPLKDLSNLDKDLAKVSPSAMADALSGDDREARTQAVIGIGGTAACGVMAWSLLTLRDTGCGLPPGPLGLVGAAEGVSYLYVLALVAWSAAKKVGTGSGLPEGPGASSASRRGSRTSSHSPASPCSWDRSKITGSSRTPSRSRGAVLRAVTDRVFHFFHL